MIQIMKEDTLTRLRYYVWVRLTVVGFPSHNHMFPFDYTISLAQCEVIKIGLAFMALQLCIDEFGVERGA